jgi:hypothetical protein
MRSPRERHIEFDNHETDALLRCLLRAAEVGESTGNLDLLAMAEDLAHLIIDKWLREGDGDA